MRHQSVLLYGRDLAQYSSQDKRTRTLLESFEWGGTKGATWFTNPIRPVDAILYLLQELEELRANNKLLEKRLTNVTWAGSLLQHQVTKLKEVGPNDIIVLSSDKPLSQQVVERLKQDWAEFSGTHRRPIVLDSSLKVTAVIRGTGEFVDRGAGI